MSVNDDNQAFEKARDETISYHKLYYSRHQLFEENSWLAKPDDGLMKLLEEYLIAPAEQVQKSYVVFNPAADGDGTSQTFSAEPPAPLKILDLGCGVGRNAVPMAMALAKVNVQAKIIGVDVLAESIDLLWQNAVTYGVDHAIEGLVVDNDRFVIEPASFDLIAAISVVEHCAGKAKVLKLLKAIAAGLKPGGLVRIEMTTDRNVIDLETKQALPTHVETPLSERQVRDLLDEAFHDFEILTLEVFPYKEMLDKDDKKILWQSKQVSFSAKARRGEYEQHAKSPN